MKIVKLDILLPNKIGHCGGKNYVSGKVFLNATALPRWSEIIIIIIVILLLLLLFSDNLHQENQESEAEATQNKSNIQ